MADFCRQCAIELKLGVCDLDDIGTDKEDILETGEGFIELCEGCGPTLVDWAGQCISLSCDKHGGTSFEKVYQTRQEYLEDKEKLDEPFRLLNEELDAFNEQQRAWDDINRILDGPVKRKSVKENDEQQGC